MKRSLSDSPSPLTDLERPISSPEIKPTLESATPVSPATKKAKTTSSPVRLKPASPATPKQAPMSGVISQNGGWTAEKRGIFMDQIIAAGYKAINLDDMAVQVCALSS